MAAMRQHCHCFLMAIDLIKLAALCVVFLQLCHSPDQQVYPASQNYSVSTCCSGFINLSFRFHLGLSSTTTFPASQCQEFGASCLTYDHEQWSRKMVVPEMNYYLLPLRTLPLFSLNKTPEPVLAVFIGLFCSTGPFCRRISRVLC